MKSNEILREEWEAYVEVQESGVTNMFDVCAVEYYAEEFCGVPLSRDQIICIQQNYAELKETYQ